MALLEASGIGKNFGETHVLKDISLDLEQGEALAIIGSSGSGKTTLLRCLNFLERPDTGVIKVNGETMWDAADPATQKESEIRKKRLHFGLVFQNFNLFPQYTAFRSGPATIRISSPAASSSVWPLPVRWRFTRISSALMSQPVPLTRS